MALPEASSIALLVPNYEEYYLQETHSDVCIVITDETASPDVAAVERRLPGHSMVLVAFSKYCRAKLDHWSTAGPSATSSGGSSCCKLELQLPVPAGQQDLAELLVKGMYQAQPTLAADLTQQHLLQLTMLADRFEVPKVMAAVMAAFGGLQPQQLEWETVLQLLQLPPSCAHQKHFEAARQLAVQRLQQQLGDLEEVWASEPLQQLLLQLPLLALQQLLQNGGTRVATENTVVYTIERWYKSQKAQQQKQLRQLMHLVRMQHCTPYYAGTLLPLKKLVQHCFEPSELLLAATLSNKPATYALLQSAQLPALQKYPAWSAMQRPLSPQKPVIKWDLEISTLQDAFQQAVERARGRTGCKHATCCSPTCIVYGQELVLAAVTVPATGNSAAVLGWGMVINDMPPGVLRTVAANLTVTSVAAPLAADYKTACQGGFMWGRKPNVLQDTGSNTYFITFDNGISLGDSSSWNAAEAALRQQQLVHPATKHSGSQRGAASPHLQVAVEVLER